MKGKIGDAFAAGGLHDGVSDTHVAAGAVDGVDTDQVAGLEVVGLALVQVGVDAAFGLPLVEIEADDAVAAAGVAEQVAKAVAHLQGVEELAGFTVFAKVADAVGLVFVEANTLSNQAAVGHAHHIKIGVTQVFGADLAQQAFGCVGGGPRLFSKYNPQHQLQRSLEKSGLHLVEPGISIDSVYQSFSLGTLHLPWHRRLHQTVNKIFHR